MSRVGRHATPVCKRGVDAAEVSDLYPATRGDCRLILERLAELREALERPARRLLRPEEFGEVIGVSGRKVYTLLGLGMPCVQILGQRRIDPEEGLTWLREHGAEVSK